MPRRSPRRRAAALPALHRDLDHLQEGREDPKNPSPDLRADFAAVDRLAAKLGSIGNIASDGRPILGLDSRDLLEIALDSGPDSYLVPAHIWTPWFAALGSQSGFDSIEDCYGDLSGHIFAVETGLSSDPEMNWRISFLDRYRLTSNSDAHSPGKLGREATFFDCAPDYFAIRRALETGDGYGGTVEFFPEEGKYHADGHRKCGVRLSPKETLALDGRCPVCGGALTIGVLHRVEKLADRSEEDVVPPPTAGEVRSLVPLPEIMSEILGVGPGSKRVAAAYDRGARQARAGAAAAGGAAAGGHFARSARRFWARRWRGCAPAPSSAMPAMTANTASSACSPRASLRRSAAATCCSMRR